jgi:hypothetical protein
MFGITIPLRGLHLVKLSGKFQISCDLHVITYFYEVMNSQVPWLFSTCRKFFTGFYELWSHFSYVSVYCVFRFLEPYVVFSIVIFYIDIYSSFLSLIVSHMMFHAVCTFGAILGMPLVGYLEGY